MRQIAEMKTAAVVALLMEENYDLVAAQEVSNQVENLLALDLTPYSDESKDYIALSAYGWATYGWLCALAPMIIRAAQQGALEWLPTGIFIGKGKRKFALLAPEAANRIAYCL